MYRLHLSLYAKRLKIENDLSLYDVVVREETVWFIKSIFNGIYNDGDNLFFVCTVENENPCKIIIKETEYRDKIYRFPYVSGNKR